MIVQFKTSHAIIGTEISIAEGRVCHPQITDETE